MILRPPLLAVTGSMRLNQRFFISLWRGFKLLLSFMAAVNGLHAEVVLPPIFGDHMVLQQGTTLPVWGKASPGEIVTVSIAGRSVQTAASLDGMWRVTIPPLSALASSTELLVKGNNLINIQDVLIGDVWICAGEGNMDFPLAESTGGKDTQGEPADHALRFFCVPKSLATDSGYQPRGRWMIASPLNSPAFSAIGYFFARDLRSTQRLPIGMIQCTTHESSVQAWISQRGLSAAPSLSGSLTKIASPENSQNAPSSLFNRLIKPLIPYALTGVIWYQGESEVGKAALNYRLYFQRLIRDWRTAWKQGPFPFFFVQSAGYGDMEGPVVESFYGEDHHERRGLPWLREGIACALRLPNTGMAVATDLGVPDEHIPPDKLDIGRRLALLARKRVYGENLVDAGPRYREMVCEGNRMRVWFQDSGGGLTLGVPPFPGDAEGPIIPTKLTGFAVAGNDHKWYAATARIEGKSVLLSSDAVQKPIAARYNWSGYTRGNLYNKEGLPAVPFRTDTAQP